MDLIPLLSSKFDTFLVIITRLGGMFFIAAFYGYRFVPIQARIILTIAVAIILLPMVNLTTLPYGDSFLGIALLLINEIAFGLFIGFTTLLLFFGIQMGGHIIGFQMGFAIVNVIDPTTQVQISTIGELKFILALLIYMAINGHHFLIKAIFQSFQIIPPGTASLNLATAEHFLRMVVNTFIIAIKIAGPAMITLFLTSVALGIIARTVPQMNVFIVGFPLKIGVGMLVLAAGLTYFSAVFTRMMSIAENNIATLLVPTM